MAVYAGGEVHHEEEVMMIWNRTWFQLFNWDQCLFAEMAHYQTSDRYLID